MKIVVCAGLCSDYVFDLGEFGADTSSVIIVSNAVVCDGCKSFYVVFYHVCCLRY